MSSIRRCSSSAVKRPPRSLSPPNVGAGQQRCPLGRRRLASSSVLGVCPPPRPAVPGGKPGAVCSPVRPRSRSSVFAAAQPSFLFIISLYFALHYYCTTRDEILAILSIFIGHPQCHVRRRPSFLFCSVCIRLPVAAGRLFSSSPLENSPLVLVYSSPFPTAKRWLVLLAHRGCSKPISRSTEAHKSYQSRAACFSPYKL